MSAVIFNPHGKSVDALPVIYGFNNGGSPGFLIGELIAQDGTFLGSHCCSHECYMPGDLGIREGARADRHEHFREHYPDGYRMEFVGHGDVPAHEALNRAFELNRALDEDEAASAIEARSDATPKSGAAEGESATARPGRPNPSSTPPQANNQ